MAKNTEKALAALLNTSSVRDAATTSGLKERNDLQIFAWWRFQKDEYQQAQRQVVEAAISRLQQIATEAVETLRRNLTCDNPQAEIRAAQLILDNVFGNSENAKPANREIVISFNFNNQVRLTNDKD